MTETARRLWTLLGIFSILCWAFWHFHSNDLILHFDSERLFSPYFSLLADYTRAGQLMLWNPWSNCGPPDGAYVELGSFSPITIGAAAISGGGDIGFLWYWLCVWGSGAAGLFVLARHEQTPTTHAIIVTIAFMFSGFYLGQAAFTSWIYSFSFLPWILWRISVGVENRRFAAAVQAGALPDTRPLYSSTDSSSPAGRSGDAASENIPWSKKSLALRMKPRNLPPKLSNRRIKPHLRHQNAPSDI